MFEVYAKPHTTHQNRVYLTALYQFSAGKIHENYKMTRNSDGLVNIILLNSKNLFIIFYLIHHSIGTSDCVMAGLRMICE
jgi:hypothetical protein